MFAPKLVMILAGLAAALPPAARADSTLAFSSGANCMLVAGSGTTCSASQDDDIGRYASTNWTGLTTDGLAQYLAGVWMAEMSASATVAGSPTGSSLTSGPFAWDFSLAQGPQALAHINTTLIDDVDTAGEGVPWRII